VRVHSWAWLPFGTRWPSNWPCPHSHRPTRTDPEGLNARNTPACQSNPQGGADTLQSTHTHTSIFSVCARVYRPRPWWPPATPLHSAAVRRDLETQDCYYSPADSTHKRTHTHRRQSSLERPEQPRHDTNTAVQRGSKYWLRYQHGEEQSKLSLKP